MALLLIRSIDIALVKISIPEIAKRALLLIEKNGFIAYLVGGTVRDLLLTQITNVPLKQKDLDIDIATNARPEEIKKIFKKFKQFYSGIRHGTVGINFYGTKIDVTTFRIEEKYSDGRRPDKVVFVNELIQDLSRRDFTINAMATDHEGNVIDPFNGIEDMKKRIIRAVNDPKERFSEDSLRMLRAVRFAAKLDFTIEETTLQAIMLLNGLIQIHKISRERIFMELEKTFSYSPSKGIKLLFETQLHIVLFPEIRDPDSKLLRFSKILEKASSPTEIVWALIYHEDVWIAQSVPFKFSNLSIEKISKFYLNKYPGMGKWKAIKVSVLLILISSVFHITDEKFSEGELWRWYFKTWHFFHKKQKDYTRDVVNMAQKIFLAQMELKLSNYYQAMKYLPIIENAFENFKLKIDGEMLKAIGLKGKTISHAQYLILFSFILKKGSVSIDDIVDDLRQDKEISYTELIDFISMNYPTGSPDEIDTFVQFVSYNDKIRQKLKNQLIIYTYSKNEFEKLKDTCSFIVKENQKKKNKFGVFFVLKS